MSATTHGVGRLVADHPLAWLVSPGPELIATPLPIQLDLDADGAPLRVRGHIARSNPQVDLLRRRPEAVILALGPNGYVSPSWMADRTQAPTWNYAAAQIAVHVELVEDEPGLMGILAPLVEAMESGMPHAWTMAEMGPRLQTLARGIVGFHARVVHCRSLMKLGQSERDEVYADILKGLSSVGGRELTGWMGAYNSDRQQDVP